ncbi:MAG: hypothetical protein LBQ58_07255 [Synergistaceae bacterium]|jgi:flagellin-like hook-associated protein FlgL|nr:hypothetical protein [Synergistaceae bacterium]
MKINSGIISALSNIGASTITTKHAHYAAYAASVPDGDSAGDKLTIAYANLSASDSKITDFAMVMEMIESTKDKIIERVDVSVPGQANQTKQDIIDLIQ